MSWVTNLREDNKITYWVPDELPEKTEEWQTNQMKKSYLKPDGSLTGHPGWYFGNGSYASDEYFYHNEGWYTIVDNRPEEIDENGNQYVIIETPSTDWEVFDTYKIRKVYKRYLHNKVNKPQYKFGQFVTHLFSFDDEKMIATDNYEVSILTQEELENQKNEFLNMIRKIRNYILEKTDYLVIQSKEKNQELSEDFISYRQALRDLPQGFNFSDLSEEDYIETSRMFRNFNFFPEQKKELNINDFNISFFPIRVI